ncbi:hypothetical protein ACFPYI_15100 [Halomarina salina]|uniref:Small CPxCG-related zinc finger protein n=1 Tax=Halomarina salina TaxID=1872699 RepID=A0ABD5RQI1_9EURY|nr:hypothetical protein [Halomarina salina]
MTVGDRRGGKEQGGDAMDCVACGLGAGFNRAVVDTVHHRELGGFCVRCEESEFGRSLARGDWSGVEGCAFCDRDGFYALPTWEPFCEERDGKTVCKVEYRVDDATVRFCDEHFGLVNESAAAGAADRGVHDDTRIR